MADYYPLIARAVAGLQKNTGDARRALYERAREALVAQLRGVTPAIDESDVTGERLSLEEAIRKVERESERQRLAGERRSLSDPVMRDFREGSRPRPLDEDESDEDEADEDEAYLTLDDITEPVLLDPSFVVDESRPIPPRARQAPTLQRISDGLEKSLSEFLGLRSRRPSRKEAHSPASDVSTLADLPELIGFFSYSREDDEDSEGALSRLRDRIQKELSGQLGRSRRELRLWQDKEAIPFGTLWQGEIELAIAQSMFFIPIVTPRAVKSQHCAYEFRAFLAREKDLGRNDLIFPIHYISVPALENERLWRTDAVLKIVHDRQYLDWRNLRHEDVGSTAIRVKLEQFCRHLADSLRRKAGRL